MRQQGHLKKAIQEQAKYRYLEPTRASRAEQREPAITEVVELGELEAR